MSDGTATPIHRLLHRTPSKAHTEHSIGAAPAIVRQPDLLGFVSEKRASEINNDVVHADFLNGVELLRVTRKKARTRKFTIAPESGVVAIDGTFKFTVDAIRDIRIGEEANHYRELCKITSEHKPRWLSIIYYQDNNKLKVLHVICPSVQLLEHFRNSLLRLYHRRARFSTAGHSIFGPSNASLDEDLWYSLVPKKTQNITSTDKGLCAVDTDRVRHAPATVKGDATASMSFDEVKALCKKLHFNASTSHLFSIFCEADTNKSGFLDFPSFKKFVDLLKIRHDIVFIYNKHKTHTDREMSRFDFIHFLQTAQQLQEPIETLHKVFERAREPTSTEKKESISPANFTAYILSRHNSLLHNIPTDMSRPMHQYFISSSHNTYLTGRQIGDISSIEPYIRALQKGCRCVEIDIWSDSDGYPEVRHGRAFTSAISLESVLKVIDKYAFIVSPWPLIISLEIRCNPKAQIIVVDLLKRTFREVLVTDLQKPEHKLPSPVDLRHRILLKIKSTEGTSTVLKEMDFATITSRAVTQEMTLSYDEAVASNADDSSVTTSAQESDIEPPSRDSRASSASSRSSSYSNPGANIPQAYRPFLRPALVIQALSSLAPYLQGQKFRNFSLPESKTFNHIFSLSERAIKHFSRETNAQLQKHNTRYLMRVYPSQARLLSTNFLPHHYWQRGIQMAAMNWQTHDAGMRMNEAFFAIDDHSSETTGYLAKPQYMLHWEKGQEVRPPAWRAQRWTIVIISGSQLPRTQTQHTQTSPYIEVEVFRPASHAVLYGTASSARERETKFRTSPVEDNGYNPLFNQKFDFQMYEDEDPFFTFLQFVVKDAISGEVLGQAFVPLGRIQMGYRTVGLYDLHGERFLFSSLFIKTMVETL